MPLYQCYFIDCEADEREDDRLNSLYFCHWQVSLLQPSQTWFGLCLQQVRQLVSHVGLEVTYLKRVSVYLVQLPT